MSDGSFVIAPSDNKGPRRKVDVMRLRMGFLSLFLPFLTSVTACGSADSGPQVLRVDSAGIEIVESPAEDIPLDWTFQREFALGGEETGPETFFAVGPMNVGSDSVGRIYVLDSQDSRVAIFSPQGEFLGTVGAHGEGPGEISMGGSLAVSPGGTVSIFDYGKGGLVRFDPAGDPLTTVPFRFYPWPGTTRHFAEIEDGYLVATMANPIQENTFRHALQFVSETDTLVVADRSFPRPEMVMYPSCGGGLNLPRIFEVQVSWAVSGNTVVVSRTDRYELEVFENRQLTQKLRRAFGTRTSSEQMALDELGEGFVINFGRGPCTIQPQEMVDARGFAETLPWILQVTLSPGGELWVGRKEVGENTPGQIDIFDRTGAYRGTLPQGTPFPLVFLDEDRFGAAEKDPMDITRLVVYRTLR